MFSYSASPPSASGRSRLNLNKRVAFPLQPAQGNPSTMHTGPFPPSGPAMPPMNFKATGNVSSSGPVNSDVSSNLSLSNVPNFQTPQTNFTSTSEFIMPPLPSITSSLPPITMPMQPSTFNSIQRVSKIEHNENLPEDEMKLITFSTLKTAFTCIPNAQKHQNPEIQRRIDTLQSTWHDLDYKIKLILYKISKAIECRDVEEATEQHRILVIDHHNACSIWAPALRQLILLTFPQDPDNDVPRRNSMTPITTPLMAPTLPDEQSIAGLSEVTSGDAGSKKNFSRVYHI